MVDGGFELHEESRFAKVAKLDRRRFLLSASATGVAALLAACSGEDSPTLAQSADGATEVSTGGTVGTAASDGDAPALRVGSDPTTSTDGSTAPSLDSTDTSASSSTSGASNTTDSTAATQTTQTTASQTTQTTQASQSTTTTQGTTATTDKQTTTTAGSGSALPAGASMTVAFTYQQQSGGKDVPPYVAVWIEDGSGNLLQTVSLWYQQYGRGEQWLPDLRRWYNVDQQRMANGGSNNIGAISGATRSPGSFQVRWDGKTNGTTAPAGSFFVCIESARERGPYSLIRQSVNLNGSAMQQGLSSDGELVNASVSVG
jgi:hypothetical protein